MSKIKMLLVGAIAAGLTFGLASHASAAFNRAYYDECVARGTARRFCCEQAGGKWESYKVVVNGVEKTKYGCNMSSEPAKYEPDDGYGGEYDYKGSSYTYETSDSSYEQNEQPRSYNTYSYDSEYAYYG